MVIVSSGFHRTHVTIAAREAARRGELRLAITGAYPTAALRLVVRATGLERGRLARLLEREEGLPAPRTCSLWAPELLEEAARVVSRGPFRGTYSDLSAAAMRLYGARSARRLSGVARAGDVYHYRAGFGQASVDRARDLGVIALCDHAAVHPLLRDTVVPSAGTGGSAAREDPVASAILRDIDGADAVVVNSNLLRDMFVSLGYPGERLHVVYLGVDERFLSYAREARAEPRRTTPLRLLFAGRFDRAKGAEVLIDALGQLAGIDWQLAIAGPIDASLRHAHRGFFDRPRVTTLGTVNRRELARQMSATPVFVLPSLSEGSARVVFEALACGCYVITTASAGSVVEDGVHGAIVVPGDAASLASAISSAAADPDHLEQVARRNVELVSQRFTQSHYGDELSSLYHRLAAAGPGDGSSRSAHRSTFVAPNSG